MDYHRAIITLDGQDNIDGKRDFDVNIKNINYAQYILDGSMSIGSNVLVYAATFTNDIYCVDNYDIQEIIDDKGLKTEKINIVKKVPYGRTEIKYKHHPIAIHYVNITMLYGEPKSFSKHQQVVKNYYRNLLKMRENIVKPNGIVKMKSLYI